MPPSFGFIRVSSNDSEPLYSPFHTVAVASGAQAVNRSSVAALAFLVWDILISMDDEVKFIWSRTWSYTKSIYFIVRYLPMLVQISILLIGSELTPHFHFTSHDCFIWQVYQGVATVLIVGAVDLILILRVHALYHGNFLIRRILAFAFFLELTGMITGLALALPGVTYDDVCLVTGVPGTLIIYGGAAILFQFLLFGLTLAKFIQAVRSGWGDVPLIKLLVRDGTWAFFLLFVVYVGEIGLYGLKNHNYAGVLFGWLLSAFSFSGYRILINLNRIAEHAKGASRPTRPTRRTDTNIQFSTQIFESQPSTYEQEESFELSSRERRTFETSQISTLSLGK